MLTKARQSKQLVAMDPRAVAHIFHSPMYSKSSAQRFFIRLLVRTFNKRQNHRMQTDFSL
jgi:hypothetical protein